MTQSTRANLSFTGLLLLLCLAFFPNLFHSLWSLPLTFFSKSPAPPLDSPAYYSPFSPPKSMMAWFQKTFTLPSKSRGSYLITDHVLKELPEIKSYKVGLLNLFVQHTSCGRAVSGSRLLPHV